MDELEAMLLEANFYPHLDESNPNRDFFSGETCTWTFELPKDQYLSPGIYKLTHQRTLAEEEALGNPVRGKLEKPKE